VTGRPPRPTRAGRLLTFLQAMFPPAAMIPAGLASFCAQYFLLQALAGRTEMQFPWRAGIGAATIILLSLLLRVYDELKDAETDLRLGRAGDPLYKDRPVVTGHIRVEDIVLLRWLVSGLVIAVNIPLALSYAGGAFAVAFILCWMSFRWFFWPGMQKNLLAAFATHNPLSAVLTVYIVAVFADDFGTESLGGTTALLVIGFWMPIAAWETSRKIRIPDDETDYQTYSKILGIQTAAMLPIVFVAISAACFTAIFRELDAPWYAMGGVHGLAGLVVVACIALIAAPSTRRARLRPVTELYMVALSVGVTALMLFR